MEPALHNPAGGAVHEIPQDLAQSLVNDSDASRLWDSLTVLGRNEFICWVEDAKREATREKRIRRTIEELHEGKRRPCCWPGCSHREKNGKA